jgi:hypothetical protein
MPQPYSHIHEASIWVWVGLVKISLEGTHCFGNQLCFLDFRALGGLEPWVYYNGVIHLLSFSEDFFAAAIIVLSAAFDGGT